MPIPRWWCSNRIFKHHHKNVSWSNYAHVWNRVSAKKEKYKEPNGNFKTEKHNNWNKRLNGWVQQYNGEGRGKNHRTGRQFNRHYAIWTAERKYWKQVNSFRDLSDYNKRFVLIREKKEGRAEKVLYKIKAGNFLSVAEYINLQIQEAMWTLVNISAPNTGSLNT